jgi:hypothetical protein
MTVPEIDPVIVCAISAALNVNTADSTNNAASI